jgi:hypothetical protein
VIAPLELIVTIVVAPFLISKSVPDWTIEKLVVVKLTAFVAVPVTLAVTVFAAKLPELSLATIVEAPFELDAVVDEFGRGVVSVNEDKCVTASTTFTPLL